MKTSRLHQLHESKFLFVSRIKFIRSKLSNFSAHVSGVTDQQQQRAAYMPGQRAGRRGGGAPFVGERPETDGWTDTA